MAVAPPRWHAAHGGGRETRLERGRAFIARPTAAENARRSRANASRCADGLADPDRLLRPVGAHTLRPHPGAVRAPRHASRRWRNDSHHAAPAFASQPSGAGHAGPRRLLAELLLRCPEGPSGPVPETSLARRSAFGGTDATG